MKILRINSKNVVSIDGKSTNIGDEILLKPQRITGIGKILKVVRETKTQLVCELVGIWFPIHDHTAFGKIDKSSNKGEFDFFCERFEVQMGREERIKKNTGNEIGYGDRSHSMVKLIDTNAVETLTFNKQ